MLDERVDQQPGGEQRDGEHRLRAHAATRGRAGCSSAPSRRPTIASWCVQRHVVVAPQRPQGSPYHPPTAGRPRPSASGTGRRYRRGTIRMDARGRCRAATLPSTSGCGPAPRRRCRRRRGRDRRRVHRTVDGVPPRPARSALRIAAPATSRLQGQQAATVDGARRCWPPSSLAGATDDAGGTALQQAMIDTVDELAPSSPRSIDAGVAKGARLLARTEACAAPHRRGGRGPGVRAQRGRSPLARPDRARRAVPRRRHRGYSACLARPPAAPRSAVAEAGVERTRHREGTLDPGEPGRVTTVRRHRPGIDVVPPPRPAPPAGPGGQHPRPHVLPDDRHRAAHRRAVGGIGLDSRATFGRPPLVILLGQRTADRRLAFGGSAPATSALVEPGFRSTNGSGRLVAAVASSSPSWPT